MGLPEIVISRSDLQALPEYSCTLPTGTTIGKRWRRDTHIVGIARPQDKPGPSEWVIGEYFDDGTPGMVAIRWSWAVSAPGVPHRGKL